MQKLIFLPVLLLLLVSCESRENKAQKLVAQELKAVLYDFDSYEPVKTKIDSAFFTPALDTDLRDIMVELAKNVDDYKDAKRDYDSALREVALWDDPYSAYSRQQKKEAIAERDVAETKMNIAKERTRLSVNTFCSKIKEDKARNKEFIGWSVSQRYRCKTGGGYPSFGDDIFILNEDMTECIFHISKEDYDSMNKTIELFSAIPEDLFNEKFDEIMLAL